MPKTIVSPVKRFSGTVVLSEPLTIMQAVRVEDAIQNIQTFDREKITLSRLNAFMEPAILACVEKWNLAGIADKPEGLPATPRKSSAELYTWIWNEINVLFEEADEIQNASGSPSEPG